MSKWFLFFGSNNSRVRVWVGGSLWYHDSMTTFRKTKKEDISELAQIYRRAYDRPEFGENWSLKAARAMLGFYLTQKTFIGITVLVDGKVVGAFLSYVKPWFDSNHLAEGEIFIDPAYQKQKIGSLLFLEMMNLAEKKNCQIHELVAYAGVAKWYKKIGMHETELKHMSGSIGEIIKQLKKDL